MYAAAVRSDRPSTRSHRRVPSLRAGVWLALIVGVGLDLGCGSAPKPVVVATTASASVAKPPPPAPIEHPARWIAVAGKTGGIRAQIDLGDGSSLWLGEGGERWLDRRDGAAPKVAESLIGEPLVGGLRDGAGLVLFGASGTAYVVDAPLGPVRSTRAPKFTARRVSVGGRAALASTRDGEFMRSTDGGASWSKVALPAVDGVPIDVVMNDAGLALALFAPQRLLASADAGATFTPIGSPGVGARELVVDGNGDVMLLGLAANATLKTSPLRLERGSRPPASRLSEMPGAHEAPPLGFAAAVEAGRAVMVEDRVLELVARRGDELLWDLATTQLGHDSVAHPVAELPACKSVALAAAAGVIEIACEEGRRAGGGLGALKKYAPKPSDEKPTIRLFKSTNGGATFAEDGSLPANGASPRIWIADDGGILLHGACKKMRTSGCGPEHAVVRAPGSKTFAAIALPHRVGSLEQVVFGDDGRAFAIGRTGAVGHAQALLASKNHGREFTLVELPPIGDGAGHFSLVEHPSLGIDADGTVAVAGDLGGGHFGWWSEAPRASSFEGRAVPGTLASFVTTGRGGVGIGRDGRSVESTDGGLTFSATATAVVGERRSTAAPAMTCNRWACLVGERIARVGSGTRDGAAWSETPTAPTKLASGRALRCETEGSWSTLGALFAAPGAYDADVAADVRWMALREDRTSFAASVLIGKGVGKDGRVERREVSLLGPAARDTATAILPQIEGAAALRYAFKRQPPAKGSTTPGPIVASAAVDVEVSWWVAATGKLHHAVIRGAEGFDPRDVLALSSGPGLAQVAMLSIAQGGVHVRPFATKVDAPLYFVSESGKVERLPFPEFPAKGASGEPIAFRVDAARVGDQSVVLGIADPGLQILSFWSHANAPWEAHTWGLVPDLTRGGSGASNAAWDVTIFGGKPTLVGAWQGSSGDAPFATSALLTASDDPTTTRVLPTQASVSEPPAACGAGSATAPRTVVPWARGHRHPITVIGEPEPIALATDGASLRMPSGGACVGAFDAVGVSAASPYTALVFPDDLSHALLFRSGVDESAVRTMKCSWASADAEPPATYGEVDGFVDGKR